MLLFDNCNALLSGSPNASAKYIVACFYASCKVYLSVLKGTQKQNALYYSSANFAALATK